MPAMHFSSVLLPLPLLPTIPKNSPSAISTLTSSTACSVSAMRVRSGWSAFSLRVRAFSRGSRKLLERLRTEMADGRAADAPTARPRAVSAVVVTGETLPPASGYGARLHLRAMRGASSNGLDRAFALLAQGPLPPPPAVTFTQRLRVRLRAALLRALRPHTAYQGMLDEAVIRTLAYQHDQIERMQLFITDLMAGEDVLRSLAPRGCGPEGCWPGHTSPASRSGRLQTPVGEVTGYAVSPIAAGGDTGYAGFEDIFRGPAERVTDLQRPYLPLVADHQPVLDLGCGRGEFLDAARRRRGSRSAAWTAIPGWSSVVAPRGCRRSWVTASITWPAWMTAAWGRCSAPRSSSTSTSTACTDCWSCHCASWRQADC